MRIYPWFLRNPAVKPIPTSHKLLRGGNEMPLLVDACLILAVFAKVCTPLSAS